MEAVLELCRSHDSSGTGKIERHQFTSILKSLKDAVPEEAIAEAFLSAGLDDDQATVNYETFAPWIFQAPSIEKSRQLQVSGMLVRLSDLWKPDALSGIKKLVAKYSYDVCQFAVLAMALSKHGDDPQPSEAQLQKQARVDDPASKNSSLVADCVCSHDARQCKASYFYAPGTFEEPWVPKKDVYHSIIASDALQRTLEQEWAKLGDASTDSVMAFKARFPGVARSCNEATQQWAFVLQRSTFVTCDEIEGDPRLKSIMAKLFPIEGVLTNAFMAVVMSGEFSFPELDELIRHPSCAWKGEWLSPYLTWWGQATGGGWGVKYHITQPEIPVGRPCTHTKTNEQFIKTDWGMVLDLVIWEDDVTKGEKMKVGVYTLPDGTKVANLCPPFPASPAAVKANEWPHGEADHAVMAMREFLPAHFHSDATTMQARLLPTIPGGDA